MTTIQNVDKKVILHSFIPSDGNIENDAVDICAAVQKALTCLKVAAAESSKKIAKITKLTLVSGTLVLTNSVLSVTVGLTKLAGFTLVSTFAIKYLTGHLHQANCALAKHGPSLLNTWATLLNEEHKRITEIEKVIWVKNGKLFFSPKNYKIRLYDSIKPIASALSLTISAVNAIFWIAVKPLYLALILPGALGDCILIAPLALNKEISKLAYSPFMKLPNKMFEFHLANIEVMADSFWKSCCDSCRC